MKKLSMLSLLCLVLLACSKEDDLGGTTTNNGGNNPPAVSWSDTLSQRWIVYNASHNGSEDASSIGLVVDIKKDGSYTLVNTGYKGTWEFQNDFTQVLLDKGNSSYKTTWTIQSISSKVLKVTFKSPFTGGNAAWELRPV